MRRPAPSIMSLCILSQRAFETALAWAQTHAPTRGVERIHVKHERGKKALGRKPRASPAAKKRLPAKKAPAKKVAARQAAPARTRAAAKSRKARAVPG